MTDYSDEFNQVEQIKKPISKRMKRLMEAGLIGCLGEYETCARCGSDNGIERNLGYKIAVCEECWTK